MATTNYGFDPEILKRRSEQGQSTGRTAAPFDHKAFEDYLLSRGENQWGGGLPTDEQMQEQVRNFINDVPAVPQFTGQTPQDGQPPAPTSVANQWTQQADQMRQQLQQQTAAPSQVPSQQIYDLISQRMGQSLEIDRNDPIIRQQADAFGAHVTSPCPAAVRSSGSGR